MAAADYAMQRRRVGKQTRMTKEEVKQEHKQSEGDPMLKGAIRSRQLAASRNRMMADIADADVVLVNPTHVAVALRYDPDHGAPRVVARGAGAIAARIRERAAEERVAAGARRPARPRALHLDQGRPDDPARALRRRRRGAGVRDQPPHPRSRGREPPLAAQRGGPPRRAPGRSPETLSALPAGR